MKVYSCPTEVPAPEPDYRNYDHKKEAAAEDAHRADLVAHFRKQGYTGKNTGETVCFPVADGHAEYMLIEGSKSFLIHLPYGDAWQYRDVQFLPKTEIVRRITSARKLSKLFGSK